MDKKKIIIAVVVIIAIIAAGLLILGSSDITLQGVGAKVTIPNNYTVDDKGVASAGDVKIAFIGSADGTNADVEKFYGAIAKSGNESGYKNYKNGTIGDFKFQEFSANPKELKNITTEKVTSGDTTSWTEYPPQMATVGMINDDSVVNMRRVTFVNTKDNTINDLIIYSNNTNIDLNTPEFDKIINSIAILEK